MGGLLIACGCDGVAFNWMLWWGGLSLHVVYWDFLKHAVSSTKVHTESRNIWVYTHSSWTRLQKKLNFFWKLKGTRKDKKWWWISTFSFGGASPSCPVAWICAWVSDWAWARLPRVFIITAITFSWTRRILMRSGCWKNVWLFTSFL